MEYITFNKLSEIMEGLRWGIQIRHLRQHQIDIIIDLRVMVTDVEFYILLSLKTVLDTQDRGNRKR